MLAIYFQFVFCCFGIYLSDAGINFYRAPYVASLAENYTYSVQFFIDTGAEDVQPVCGIVYGTAMENCLKSGPTQSSSYDLTGTGYSIVMTPATRRSVPLQGYPTFELKIYLKPPEVAQAATTISPFLTPPSVNLPTTTDALQSVTNPPLRKLTDSTVTLDIYCCLPSDIVNNINRTTTWLRIIPIVDVQWSNSPNETTFRKFANPAHVERATCSCDLKKSVCDLLCCCDSLCSVAEKQRFKCDETSSGDYLDLPPSIPLPPYDCADLLVGQKALFPSAAVFNPFPHAWLCIMYRNTAYLGEYFQDLSFASIFDRTFLEARKEALPGGGFYSTAEFASNGYRQNLPLLNGDPLKFPVTANSSKIVVQNIPLRANMFFPGKGPDGRCLRRVPIRFLKSDSVLCTSNPLSTIEQCRNEFSQARYFSQLENIIARVDSAGTANRLPRLPCACSVAAMSSVTSKACEFKNETFCSQATPVPRQADGQRCSCTASDITLPTVINNNDQSWYCNRFVKSVELTMGWSGNGTDGEFSSVSVKLGDKLSPGQSTEQQFSVKFKKSIPRSDPSTTPPSQPQTPWKWYRLGDEIKYLPLKSSTTSNNQCDCLSPIPLKFGYGSATGCEFKLSVADFGDCDNLRGMAMAALKRIIPAEKLARNAFPTFPGDSTAASGADWVAIQRLRKFPKFYPDCATDPGALIAELPSKVGRFPRLYRQLDLRSRQSFSGRVAGQLSSPNSTTFCGRQLPSRLDSVNLLKEFNTTERTAEFVWTVACGTKRICERVPTAIQLSIFRSITGAKDGVLQHEIIGGAISFSVRDLYYDETRNNAAFLRAFVNFVDISSEPPKPTFVERLTSMSKPWDILYPIKGDLDPEKAKPVAAAAGLGLLLVAVLVLAPPK